MGDITEAKAWPRFQLSSEETGGALTATSLPTAVTASASLHTKGSYTELLAATTKRSTCLMILIRSSTAASDFLIDVATGAAGSEVVLIPDLLYASSLTDMNYTFPLRISAGTRISARCQADVSAAVCLMAVYVLEEE